MLNHATNQITLRDGWFKDTLPPWSVDLNHQYHVATARSPPNKVLSTVLNASSFTMADDDSMNSWFSGDTGHKHQAATHWPWLQNSKDTSAAVSNATDRSARTAKIKTNEHVKVSSTMPPGSHPKCQRSLTAQGWKGWTPNASSDFCLRNPGFG